LGKNRALLAEVEESPTQERIKNILEGGREAFERRGEKYGYKF
jgi:hypothetical protein